MRVFTGFTSLVVLLAISTTVLGADLKKGLDAFAAGDYETAMAECQPLADEGNVEAMFCVGRMYANGFGVPMDDAMTLKWYGLAAEAGHAEAQYNLGVMNANGWGVAMNDESAVGYYRQAAEQGHIPAQMAMGSAYDRGAGIDKNLQTAYMWFDVAAQRGDTNAAVKRDMVAERLSEEEVAAAQHAARAWLDAFDDDDMHVEVAE